MISASSSSSAASVTSQAMQNTERKYHPQARMACIRNVLSKPRLLPENVYATLVADCLIRPDGSFDRNLIPNVERLMVRRDHMNNPRPGFDTHLANVLRKFRDDTALNTAFATPPASLSEEGASIIRTHLCMPQTKPIKARHIQKVRLATLLARWRQFETGTCYIIAINNFKRSSRLQRVIEEQRELLERGCVDYTIEGKKYSFRGLNVPFRYPLHDVLSTDNIPQLLQTNYIGDAIRLCRKDTESNTAFQDRVGNAVRHLRGQNNASLLSLLNTLLPRPRTEEGQRRFEHACRIAIAGFEPPLSRMHENAMASVIFPPFHATGGQQNVGYEVYRDTLIDTFQRLVSNVCSALPFHGLSLNNSEQEIIQRYDTIAQRQQWRPPRFSEFRLVAVPPQDPRDPQLHVHLYMNDRQVTEESFGSALKDVMVAAMLEKNLPTIASFLLDRRPEFFTDIFIPKFSQTLRQRITNCRQEEQPWDFVLNSCDERYWCTVLETPYQPNIRITLGNSQNEKQEEKIVGIYRIVQQAAERRRIQNRQATTEEASPIPLLIPGHMGLFTPNTILFSIPCDTQAHFTEWAQARMNAINNVPTARCPLTCEKIQEWVKNYLEGIPQEQIEHARNELKSDACHRMSLQAYIQLAIQIALDYRLGCDAAFNDTQHAMRLDWLDFGVFFKLNEEQSDLIQTATIRYADTNWEHLSSANTFVSRDLCFYPSVVKRQWESAAISKDWSHIERHKVPWLLISASATA